MTISELQFSVKALDQRIDFCLAVGNFKAAERHRKKREALKKQLRRLRA